MKKPKFEITPERFYLVGKYAFFIIAVIGLIRIVDLWSVLKSYDIFSSLANAIFYFVLSAFFAKLQRDSMQTEVNDGDIIKMNEALENLNLTGNKNAKKR